MTTIPVDAPSCAETRQAFDEVSLALHSVSSAHEEVKAGMQTLASGVEELHRARASDVETTAQIQCTLQRMLSASGDLEMRVGHADKVKLKREQQRKRRAWPVNVRYNVLHNYRWNKKRRHSK